MGESNLTRQWRALSPESRLSSQTCHYCHRTFFRLAIKVPTVIVSQSLSYPLPADLIQFLPSSDIPGHFYLSALRFRCPYRPYTFPGLCAFPQHLLPKLHTYLFVIHNFTPLFASHNVSNFILDPSSFKNHVLLSLSPSD